MVWEGPRATGPLSRSRGSVALQCLRMTMVVADHILPSHSLELLSCKSDAFFTEFDWIIILMAAQHARIGILTNWF